LLAYEVPIALFMLLLVGWANLPGVKEAGRVFSVPTYAFVVMIFHHGWTPDAPRSRLFCSRSACLWCSGPSVPAVQR